LFLGCICLELLDLVEWNDCWECFLLLELLDCKEEKCTLDCVTTDTVDTARSIITSTEKCALLQRVITSSRTEFYVLLTVHPGMILVNNQFDTQFFSLYVYFYSPHVSGGDRDGTVVKGLCYKSEGRWFDPSFFIDLKILSIALWPWGLLCL